MSELIRHRGPDDHGFLSWSRNGAALLTREPSELSESEVLLAHRRLSIIDLSEGGWQPQKTPDGRFLIVYNGEIYNYLELKQELQEKHGVQFRTESDTEVLLQAYATWGEKALTRFVGMFAFVIFDTRERRVFAARDFFGIKPLYYSYDGGQIIFASEAKAIAQVVQKRRRIEPSVLGSFVRFGQTDGGGLTLFEGIHQIPAGHFLSQGLDEASEPRCTQYWYPRTDLLRGVSSADAVQRVRELFLKNIELHLRSDVAVGAALSGGIDSSAIVCGMRLLGADSLDLHTFSFISSDQATNEEKWMDVVSDHVRPQVHKVHPTADELVRDLDHLVYTQDFPFGSTSIYAQYRVFQKAHEAGIKVMLDGQGADEIFAGYIGYLGARLTSLVRQGRWIAAGRFVRSASATWSTSQSHLIKRGAASILPERMQDWVRPLAGHARYPSWLRKDWFEDRNAAIVLPSYVRGRRALTASLERSLMSDSIPNLLRYEDRNSMAHSVESRVPFLTPELVEYALSLPEEMILAPDGTSKSVLRQALQGIVPKVILDRKDKIGFQTPEKQWLTTLAPWVENVLASDTIRQVGCLRPEVIRSEWDRVQAGDKAFSHEFWRVLNLVKWVEMYEVELAG